jgi:DtxR family transcriptional regulator, Mn-dependent transcriptional regulator
MRLRRSETSIVRRWYYDYNRPMLASQTVENYLKTIFLAQAAAGDSEALVPTGQIAAALDVVPGTATAMIKALAESGLVDYEPYMGVRLTTAGEKLAGLVLRRHRLVELFLVKVLGMSWAEVHEEAERLEHAVSERLIDRIDEMLGRPTVDPHGDPIPTAEGRVARHDHADLLTAPLATPLIVTRIVDQDPVFLRFVEQEGLIPGQRVEIEQRDNAADAVRLKHPTGRVTTVGLRAASKVLVEAI